MKKQIKRLSPHQNGKVFAVLMTISAILMFIPMAIVIYFVGSQVDQNSKPVELPIFMFAIMPIFYLLFGYIFIAIGCAIYNFVYRFVGGFEFEIEEKSL
jgi:ABC-type multidrug transport system fused ATPase/permease subunit